MKRLNSCILSASLLLLIVSCKKEETSDFITVSIQHSNMSGVTSQNRYYTLDSMLVYLSNFIFEDSAGNFYPVKEVYLYKSGENNTFQINRPKAALKKFYFSFGLNPAQNNANPVSFPIEHPMSREQGMYWDMLKYRFLVAEGSIDSTTSGAASIQNVFSMHLGSDTLYRVLSTNSIPQAGGTYRISLNASDLFVLDEANFRLSNFSNHSTDESMPNAISITDAFTDGIMITAE